MDSIDDTGTVRQVENGNGTVGSNTSYGKSRYDAEPIHSPNKEMLDSTVDSDISTSLKESQTHNNPSSSDSNNGMLIKKKKRLLDDLRFSSPGPAFLNSNSISSDGGGTESEGESSKLRPRRQSRLSSHSINGNSMNGQQSASTSQTTLPKPELSLRSSSPNSTETKNASLPTKPSIFRNFTPKFSNPSNNEASTNSFSKPTNGKTKHVEKDRNGEGRKLNGSRSDDHADSYGKVVIDAEPSSSSSDRKERLLTQRRNHMEKVYKEHDILVRELFHLRKFVTLFGFDPEVALQDRSDVFERFRMDFDLATQLSASNGRTTRRLVSARRGDLSLPKVEVQRQKISISSKEESQTKKEKQNGKHGNKKDNSRSRKASITSSNASDEDDESVTSSQIPNKRTAHIKKRGKKSNSKEVVIYLDSPSSSDAEESINGSSVIHSKKRKGKESKFIYEPRKPPEIERIDGIPRLRVLQPANLPLASSHDHSLSSYLSSWHTSGELIGSNGEWQELSREEVLRRDEREAATYQRIDKLRSEGLLQSREEALKKSHQNRAKEAIRKQNYWDTILAQVTQEQNRKRVELRNKIQMAKRRARLIQEYWDEKLGRGEKQRKAEERRVRALAKTTVREVRKQWKLAVNVIRAQRLEQEKQEKDRVGREQLRNILEQSSQMLGQQHKALLEMEAQMSESEESSLDISDDEESEGDDDDDDDDESGSALSEGESDSIGEGQNQENGKESDLAGMITPLDNADLSEEESDFSIDEESEEEENSNGEDSDAEETSKAGISQLLLEDSPTDDEAESEEVVDYESEDPQARMTSTVATEADDFDADEELRPLKTTRTQQSSTNASTEADNDTADEDAELERKMWEEDISESENSEEINSDAEMSIEELRKKYGYGTNNGIESDAVQSENQEDDEDTKESLEAEKSDDDEPMEEISNTELDKRTGNSTPNSERQSVKVKPPFLLRGNLRPYQQIGFEWLVNLYNSGSNGILADEMGLGKTIQTIAMLGHLACDKGIWGPHLVVAPTSVMLNWEVEFKKFLPGFKILSYYGSQRERKEKRKGWNSENNFNVCITSYQLILADQHILRRKAWQYLVLDEAHHIKNFRSQRWQTLLGFNSQRRLLLTGTPLQNNLMDLWSLMYFLMPNGINSSDGTVNSGFASMKEFQQWFSNPLNRAVESAGIGTVSEEMDEETKGMVSKLHVLLRPYLLRRLKSEVEREMPNKYEHVIRCRLSKRQQFLYNDFMSRAKTRESLASGNYLSIINCLMQLRKVCNHPDLFEQRPIVTSFAMNRSAVADYETKELLIRRELLQDMGQGSNSVNLDVLNLQFNHTSRSHLTPLLTRSLKTLDAADQLPFAHSLPATPEPIDTWSVDGYAQSMKARQQYLAAQKWQHIGYLNRLRCQASAPMLFDDPTVKLIERFGKGNKLLPFSVACEDRRGFLNRCDSVHKLIYSHEDRREAVQGFIDRFAFVTPRAVSTDMPKWALPGFNYDTIPKDALEVPFDTLHAPAVKLQIAFPDASLLQYDCGKMQELAKLMDQCKYGTHRILIFTQMTKVLDILEVWLNYNGFNYLRLDGQTKVEDRQSLTERFNRDERIKAFILSTRSGGLGINLTGADMVLFWDLDWNFQIEAQCMDRAHRIGQTRDVHIYRFVSEHTIEENMLKKSQEKRLLDAMVIQDGQFTTEGLGKMSWIESMFDEGGRSIAGVKIGGGGEDEDPSQQQQQLEKREGQSIVSDKRIEQAMDEVEDEEDAQAAKIARAEIHVIDDEFAEEMDTSKNVDKMTTNEDVQEVDVEEEQEAEGEDEGGTIDDYMLRFVDADWDYFSTI